MYLVKSEGKDIYNVKKIISISNKCCCFELSTKFPQTYQAAEQLV